MAITLTQALQQLESGDWVSLRYLTANVAKASGGKVVELAKVKIARRQTAAGLIQDKSASLITPDKLRNPNHNLNFTRNVETQQRAILTIHPILMTHLNGEAIL